MFALALHNYSLFYQGLVGINSIDGSGQAAIDSYSAATMLPGTGGDVFTNGRLSLSNQLTINGDAMAKSFDVDKSCKITGTKSTLRTPSTFMDKGV